MSSPNDIIGLDRVGHIPVHGNGPIQPFQFFLNGRLNFFLYFPINLQKCAVHGLFQDIDIDHFVRFDQ